jgi:hypothetical protein
VGPEKDKLLDNQMIVMMCPSLMVYENGVAANKIKMLGLHKLVFLQKLLIRLDTQEIPRLLWKHKPHYHVHNSPSPVPTLRLMNPVHTLQSCFPKIRHIRLGLPNDLTEMHRRKVILFKNLNIWCKLQDHGLVDVKKAMFSVLTSSIF